MYRKMHIPDDPLYYEKFYFTPGDLGFRSLRHAVRPDRRAASAGTSGIRRPPGSRPCAGAQIIFYPTAIGWHPPRRQSTAQQQHEAWETIQRSHAIANGVLRRAVNRVGHEGAADGRDRVLGRQLRRRSRRPSPGQGRRRDEEILIVECDLGTVDASAPTGPFSATAASTPTGHRKRFID